MLMGIKLRLYPNRQQQDLLWQMFGNDRFVWNQMLAMMNERYKNNHHLPFLGKYKLDRLLNSLKQEYPFLKKSDSSSLQVVNANLNQSWKNFFDKSNPKASKPRFHSKKAAKLSYTGKSTVHVVAKRYLRLPKLGYIKTSNTAILANAKIKRYTVSLEPTGKYYLSLQVEKEVKQLSKTKKAVGIDVGVADLAIMSNGFKYETFDGSYFEHKAKLWQRKFSRRRHQAKVLVAQDYNRRMPNPRSLESFKNWEKARAAKARYQYKVKNQRKDYLHKVTTELVKNYDMIAIEDLRTKNLLKNHHLAKSISNASWRMFRTMLEYKCEWYGKQLIVVNPKNTSRICSSCGFNSGETPLEIREWTCPKCKTHHDRDINAAINILNRAKPTGQGLDLVR